MRYLGSNTVQWLLGQCLLFAAAAVAAGGPDIATDPAIPKFEAVEQSLYQDPRKALTVAETALANLPATHRERSHWEAIAADAALTLELPEPALTHAQSGLALIAERDLATELGQRLLTTMAAAQQRTGRLSDGIETINGVVSTLESGNLPSRLLVDALAVRANMYSDSGNFRAALADLLRAYALAEPPNDDGRRGDVAGYLGLVYEAMRDYVHAAQYHQEALASAEQHGELVMQSIEEFGLARALQFSGQFNEAEKYYKQSREHSEQIKDDQGVAFADAGLAELALNNKMYDHAERLYRSALPAFVAAKNVMSQGAIANGMGAIALSRQQYSEAIKQAGMALEIADRTQSPEQQMKAHDLLSQVHFATGDLRSAYDHGALARQLEKTQLMAARDLSVAEMDERFSSERRKQENESLRQKNELNEQQIVEQERRTRFYYVASAFLFILVGFLVFTIYRNRQLRDKLSQLALTDALTGIANRRSATVLLEQEFTRARRYGFPLSIAMIDLDNFKSINDDFGHDACDEVLRDFCQMVRGHLRLTDAFGRWGGEEFIVILPHIGGSDAVTFAESMREAMSTLTCKKLRAQRQPTFSAGIAVQTPEDSTVDDLIGRADAALYRAKNNGRNCLVLG